MDSIIIKVSDLQKITQELVSGNMEYVRLDLTEADEEFPACVAFHAISKNHDDAGEYDYEEIDEVKNVDW